MAASAPDWLAEATLTELNFLQKVSKMRCLNEPGPYLNNAVRRYETMWLPLLKREDPHRYIVPPLDIHWVWHCHMLSPKLYREDCLRLIGTVPDHSLRSPSPMDIIFSTEVWYNANDWMEPYDDPTPSDSHPPYEQKSLYDLTDACLRQGTFYYNVSLPHYRDSLFIKNAVSRYKKFLLLRRNNPNTILVPCYDVDIVWHTHQLHPIAYHDDMLNYLGNFFNHDDTDSDRSPEGGLNRRSKETCALWMATFKEEFSLAGAMYRGAPPHGKMHTMERGQLTSLCGSFGTVSLTSITKTSSSRDSLREQIIFFSKGQPVAVLPQASSTGLASNQTVWSGTPLLKLDWVPGDVWMLVSTNAPFRFSNLRRNNQACIFNVRDFLPQECGTYTGMVPMNMQCQLGSVSLHMQGTVTINGADPKILLTLQAFQFETVAMPDSLEQLWGPVPVSTVPHGMPSTCVVATHRLFAPNSLSGTTPRFSVRVIHCLPLLMSAVQVFADEKMVAVSHLVGLDQIPDSEAPEIGNKNACITLHWKIKERAMVIKNNNGDCGFVFGSWVHMKDGIRGTSYDNRGTRGNPGNLQIRFVPTADFSTVSEQRSTSVIVSELNSFKFDIMGIEGCLSSQEMTMSDDHVAEKVALAFSVAVLNALCQPPPIGYSTPSTHTDMGVVFPPLVRTSGHMNGPLPVRYLDSGRHALVSAAGWLMATPSNAYLANCAQKAMGSGSGNSAHCSAEIRLLAKQLAKSIIKDHNTLLCGASSGCGGCGGCSAPGDGGGGGG